MDCVGIVGFIPRLIVGQVATLYDRLEYDVPNVEAVPEFDDPTRVLTAGGVKVAGPEDASAGSAGRHFAEIAADGGAKRDRFRVGPWDHEAYLSGTPMFSGEKPFGPQAFSGAFLMEELAFQWFDHYLKGEETSADDLRASSIIPAWIGPIERLQEVYSVGVGLVHDETPPKTCNELAVQ